MARLFGSIYDYFASHKTIFWCVFIVLFLLVGAGASRIRFENNINKMIPHDPNIEAMNNILNHTKTGEQLIFSLRFKDSTQAAPDQLIERQQELEAALLALAPQYIQSIQSIQDADKEQVFSELAINYLPIFLDSSDYKKIDSITLAPDLEEHFRKLHHLLLSPAGMVAKRFAAADPLNMTPLAFNKLQALSFDPNFELYNGYIFNSNLKKLNFFVTPTLNAGETGKNKPFIAALNKIITQFTAKHPDTDILYFGGLAVGVANAEQMQTDTIVTLSLTIVLLLGLTYYVFRRKRISLIIIVPVLFGALFGMSITALLTEQVSIIAIGAGAIILGIAVDFSVHFMSHTRTTSSIKETVAGLSAPLTLGAITTIGAFYALRFANAPLLRDLGTFASFSLMGASLFTLILLPHISPRPRQVTKDNLIDKLAARKPEGNKWLLALVILATPVLWYYSKDVGFDSNLMNLNYMSPQLKKAEQELNKDNAYALSSLFVLTKGISEEQALQKMEQHRQLLKQLKSDSLIRNVIDPSSLLPSLATQTERINRWKAYWTPEKIQAIMQKVKLGAQKAGFSDDAFNEFSYTLSRDYQAFDSSSRAFLKAMLPASFAQNGKDYYSIATVKIAPGKRAAVISQFNKEKGITATDRQSVSEKLLDLLQDDFNKLLLISGGLVFIALLIAYGRFELALISFLPMAVSWVWITGLMSILGLQFNVVNIVIATLLFGLGDDYSIFMMDSLMEKYRTGKNHIKSARSAVYLSVLTTVTGLGTLVFAQHPALQSIALIAVLGLICVVFVSQVLQPFLFNFLIQSRTDKGFMPFTILSLIKSVFAFMHFVIGCLLVSFAGIFLVRLRLFGKERGKSIFHYILNKYTSSVIYLNHKFGQQVIKAPGVNFDRPAVYIANHSSFLDILIMTMLHPKLVLLTNKWVYRSPVFGAVVRMAEYYPVADGAAESIEPLRGLVARGYSIVVFPEGTRSKTDKIARFHKGAFFIAEELKLDIIPVILHGVHYTMQKGDFLLKNGFMHIEALPPIAYTDRSWGDTVKDRTKSIAQYFRKEFNYVKATIETPTYFREQLVKGYIYKGPVLEWYCRIKTRLEDNYELLHTLLPREGRFYDLGCGYGFATYLLHWASEARTFTGVDYDEEKISTAQHHYKRTEKINFETGDISSYNLLPCTGIIVSDVLHYLTPAAQLAVLEKCYTALEPGGVLIIRDGIKELAERHKGTELSEQFSTHIMGFNKTKNELHFIYKKDIETWAAKYDMQIKIIDNTKNTSNIMMLLYKS
ncbi:MAG: hypothetical protein BGO31_06995 [Bacteroidetes bacterium 43-16]|nr:MAG: hypothetical protein BGO31_06995 [Bacteroidetes bacterium 43-16]